MNDSYIDDSGVQAPLDSPEGDHPVHEAKRCEDPGLHLSEVRLAPLLLDLCHREHSFQFLFMKQLVCNTSESEQNALFFPPEGPSHQRPGA